VKRRRDVERGLPPLHEPDAERPADRTEPLPVEETEAVEPERVVRPSSASSPPPEAVHAAPRAGSPGDIDVPPGSPDAGPEEVRPVPRKPPPFVFSPLKPYKGLVRRFLIVYQHVLGLLLGGMIAYARALPPERRSGLRSAGPRLVGWLVRPLVARDIRRLPFPQQLRRRLEILGPTYIKLGQIMAIREDLLPGEVTRELENLFDRLPSIPFPEVRTLIEESLGRRLDVLFRWISEEPLGSASIAQAHRAELPDGTPVVIKVIKPGIKDIIESDLKLLQIVGVFLQWVIPRYQPRQIIREFSNYTIKEVDYTFEADNAETFAANFRDMPQVVFPRIYRSHSSPTVLTMEFMNGFKPGSPSTFELSYEQRAALVDAGAAAIIRMLYKDGFFHADLHAGNLMILQTPRGYRVGFIDLGMVGRFEDRIRRRMLYYFHALVSGDVEGATRHLADMATVGPKGDPIAFRRAVADLSRRFVMSAHSGDISIAQLILESVGLGGKYRVFFPVEMTLMVKALVTFEGVGRLLQPDLDVAAVSERHVASIFHRQFNPQAITRDLLRSAPELVDLALQAPQLLASGFRAAEEILANRRPGNPLEGIRSSIIAASLIVGGVITLVTGGSLYLAVALFALAFALAVWGK
jgi:ubiquinone biosynthesis protein